MRIVKNLIKKNTLPLLTILISLTISSCTPITKEFNPQRALADVEYQTSLGPRVIGSEAHEKVKKYIIQVLTKEGWSVSSHRSALTNGEIIENIIAERGKGDSYILLGAHYDTRLHADRDPDPLKRTEAVPGANDGGSGVAVLLEIARVLPQDLDIRIRLAFFDAEDNGDIAGYDWSLGSQAYANSLELYPKYVVIVDMVGDKDLTLYQELNSDPELTKQIWSVAKQLEFPQFIDEKKHSIIDDHLPFIQLGIPSVDIIDIEYPYWHTTQDITDKISENSLLVVGQTLIYWITTVLLP